MFRRMERRTDRRMVRLRRGALLFLRIEYDRRFIKLQNPKPQNPKTPECQIIIWGKKIHFFRESMKLVLRPEDGTSITHEHHLDESSVEGTSQLWLLRPDLVDGVVGGDDQARGPDLLASTLELADESVLVSPDLEVMTETSSLLVKVIDDHRLGVGLKSAPPLVAVLEVSTRALGPGCSGLTCTRWAPEPEGSGLGEVFALVISGLEGLDVGFNLEVV